MAKPIPVFSFVFAAYAATCARAAPYRPPAPKDILQPSDPFIKAWRLRSAAGDNLCVRVALPGPAGRGPSAPEDGVWLDHIRETPAGFVGVAMAGTTGPGPIKSGQRLRFLQMNVLEWRAGDGQGPGETPQRPGLRRHPRDMRDDLTEIVGA